MTKRVRLRLDGSLEEGFRVMLEVGEEGQLHFAEQDDGHLPAAPELLQCLQNWQQSYQQLSGATRAIKLETIAIQPKLKTQVETCRQQGHALEKSLQAWLKSDSFHGIDTQLREAVNPQDFVRVVVRSPDRRLHLLPWHSWDFIDHYQAEVAFSLPTRRAPEQLTATKSTKKVRILAILGHSTGIDIGADHQILNRLPNAEVTFLAEPNRQEIERHLWEQAWDVLFFAGHSETADQAGRIHINPEDSLTMEELKYGLKRAIAHGLQLAIFNSCDGLGLVYELEQLGLPQLIVMRQPVPDLVAQAFLKHLLTNFVQGQRFYLAVRDARERLQSWENHYPCASWLPVIFQTPNQSTLTWQDLGDRKKYPSPPSPSSLPRSTTSHVVRPYPHPSGVPLPRPYQIAAACLVVTGLVLGARSLGWLQPAELWAYDQFMNLQVQDKPDPNLLIVAVDEQDVKQFGKPLQDKTVYQLLTKLEKYHPKVIGLDILRDQPQGTGWKELTQFFSTNDRVIAICRRIFDAGVPAAPPPNVSPARVGYGTALVYDDPDMIRRYLIAQEVQDQSSCATANSFALQVIHRAFPANYQLQSGTGGIWIGTRYLETIPANFGGYQLSPSDPLGYQFLIDYRSRRIARMASLTDIFNGKDTDLQEWIRDRMVLIGYVGATSGDEYLTPRGKLPGVLIHAHAVSQVLRTIAENRSLFSSWSEPIEGFWIFGWSAIAGGLVWITSRRISLILLGSALMIIIGSSFVLFFQSIWVPVIPAALALLGTGSVAMFLKSRCF